MTRLILDRHARGPRARMISKRAPNAIARIRVLADAKSKEARVAYSAEYGFEVKDKRIDRKIAELFTDALINGKRNVQVPIHLVLALWLREGGAGRRVGRLSENSLVRQKSHRGKGKGAET